MKIRVDRSAVTFLPMCACGWRGLPMPDHNSALRAARHHELRAHPGDRDAKNALTMYNSRRK